MSRLLTPGQLWLYRTKPQDDELFSSWLVRLAWGCAIKLQTFCTKVLSQPPGFLIRDIDREIPFLIMRRLSEGTAVDAERITQTSLKAFEGYIFESPISENNRKRLPWVLPIGRYGRYRVGYGQQYCRLCLKEDSEPYFRRHWRLSLSVVCIKHGTYLRDACPWCGKNIVFHTGDFNEMFTHSDCRISFCGHCKKDLRQNHFGDELVAETALIDFQKKLLSAISNGYEKYLPGAENYSLLFFEGFRQIIKLLISNGHAKRLRNYLLSEHQSLALAPCSRRGQVIFEELRLGDRAEILSLSLTLIANWPTNFVSVCKRSRLSSSYITESKQRPLAYWLTNSAREYLYDEDYSPSNEERRSVIDYLLKSGMSTNENEVRRWLGLSFAQLRNEKITIKARWNPRGPKKNNKKFD